MACWTSKTNLMTRSPTAHIYLEFLPPPSAVEVIESGWFVCLSVHECVWACETYLVHHYNGPELLCGPPSCTVHHLSVLCTMVHKGDSFFRKVGVAPSIFKILVVNKEQTDYRHLVSGDAQCIELRWFSGSQGT